MATAARISRELDIKTVDLDWMFCEWLADCLYSTNPLPSLEIRHKDASNLDKEFDLQSVSFVDTNAGDYTVQSKIFPETQLKGDQRAKSNFDR